MNSANPAFREPSSDSLSGRMNSQKENFQTFKQKKFREIDEARNICESRNKSTKKSVPKPSALNLRNLNIVEQGPPTFDSEYEFKNTIITDQRSRDEDNLNMQYNLRLQSMIKQYQAKVNTQAQRYQLEIRKLKQQIAALRKRPTVAVPETQYCHICSNGEIVLSLNKMLKSLEEAHKDCITHQNESSKRTHNLERSVEDHKRTQNDFAAEKTFLKAEISTLKEQIQTLKGKLQKHEQSNNSAKLTTFEDQKPTHYYHPMSQPTSLQRSIAPNNMRLNSSIYSSLNQQPVKRSSTPGLFGQQLRTRRAGNITGYESQMQAAQIIDRVKSNSLMSSQNQRPSRTAQDRKLNFA